MSKADGHGIVGVLDQMLSAGHAATLPSTGTDPQPGTSRLAPGATHAVGTPTVATRRGRPPGKSSQTARPKEKLTLRITSTLVASYRDWSCEARSQLSQLVEQALADYHNRQRNQRPTGR